ncbi:non-ribosomal peptide synthetase [Chondromyces apiculatus]|uniref:Long-chain-fatty-acid--CoA ligase n=1 Tax=Chondromyces apiculatus DSM 436 TaxID=1192034 RepID=A0A017TJS6_9BACT|nr:non-ribosomal peptide synthetase [Chondromyces apiculatus]EYF08906.1 Long-chain-fatty-acid--CoA ligase [Chondromyces apiculatus DSM 436]
MGHVESPLLVASSVSRRLRLHELFTIQAAQWPDKVAVSFENRTLSYRALDEASNRFAHHLQGLGVGRGSLVIICLDRSEDFVVAILGVVKAGGAYVPLDPAQSDERLSSYLSDTQASVVVTSGAIGRSWPSSVRTVLVDEHAHIIAREPVEAPGGQGSSDDLAYVMFTSGSTGTPKGVMITHHNAVRFIRGIQPCLGIEAQDVVALFNSFFWDASVWMMWGALLRGAQLALASLDDCRALHRFARLLQERRVTSLLLTPSVFRQLMPIILSNPADYALRAIAIGGEMLSFASLLPWFDRFGDGLPHLFNAYGPTEITVASSFRRIAREDAESDVGSLIGRPLPDMQYLVLDQDLRPVPEGQVGELFIAGEGLGRGYLRRPGLTADRYLAWFPDGRRIYRTGDRVRRRGDGDTEYLGRVDDQVKIRGHRIEPREIVMHLESLPGVSTAVVVARGEHDAKQLVAYVVPHEGRVLTAEGLKQSLLRNLPEYMVPAAFVFLERLPLQANDKVDLRALPAPRVEVKIGRVPETKVERVLARLFAEALRLPSVGLDDGFLASGGDSLSAAGILWGIQQELGVDLPFRALLAAGTLAELAKLVEQLACSEASVLSPPPPLPRNRLLPLSSSQAQLWHQQRRAPEVPAYNETFVIRPRGLLDEPLLRQALRGLVQRHEVLRCVFVEQEGQPYKRVLADAPVEIYALDLRALSPAERASVAQEQVAEIARRPFDLKGGPLIRFTLVRWEEGEHRLFVTYHHLILDGLAVRVFFSELEAEVNALRAGREDIRPALPLQESEYCAWQLSTLETSRPRLVSYWQERLAGLPELALPTDRPRSGALSLRGESRKWQLSSELSMRARVVAAEAGVTRYMLLLAAFVAFLQRHAGGDEVVLGTFAGGRTLPGSASILGCFVNALVLRIQVDKDAPFRELLARVRDAATEAYAHQDLPFPEVVAAVSPPRHPGKNPLFQVAFAGDPLASPGGAGWRLEHASLDRGTSQFDLTFQLVEQEDGMSLVVEHSTELFDASTVARMVRRYLTLLEGAITALEAPVSLRSRRAIELFLARRRLPLMPAAELDEIRRFSNAVPAPPAEGCLHHLVEAQAARTPDALAAVFEGERLSYRQLDARANQVAHLLRARGVHRGTRVGLCLERSLSMLVGLLGILKAGGAYVPLDPVYPSARLAFMIEDAALPLLLAERRTVGVLPAHGARVVLLDEALAEIDAQPVTPPDVAVSPDDIAYVIYTSGSTGRPKGALVPHRGLCNLAPALIQAFGIRPESRVLQFASICFDASAMEILMALPAGATLVLAPASALLPGPALRRLVREQHVTVTLLTPSALAALSADGAPVDTEALPLTTIIAGGEPCPPQLVARFAPGRRFFNAYGPTEATICATVASCAPDGQRPTVGRALPEVRCLVLDERLEPVPIGVPGELYLGGVGVGHGYLGRAALTATRFVPDPTGGGRLYRTGDRARWRGDGEIELIGRVDEQIKLRGFRIEPGEIEAALALHPAVSAAVVGRVELSPGEPHLVAWIVPRVDATEPRETLPDALKTHLRGRLPAHMVPSVITVIDQIPVSPGGKIDRARLPVPRPAGERRPTTSAPPPEGLAALIASIWQSVLRVPVVGLHDNFFDLGGHSLLMGEVHARLERALGSTVPVTALFQFPTVASLAEHLEGERSGTSNDASGRLALAQESHDRAVLARVAMQRARNQAAGWRMRRG